ncbi:uncharacterized protein LOC111829024, partial [Capsella rubella]|uniref:uncharacterized protein LOC111829024 n=1 Tax=Capsella rubella TaxID=81985 RepID=UPI000CD5A57A
MQDSSLPATVIEKPSSTKASDAGGGAYRRRRDLTPPINMFWFLLTSSIILVLFVSLQALLQPSPILSPPLLFNDNQETNDRGRSWGSAFALPVYLLLVQPSTPRSRTNPITLEEISHRTSLMAGGISLGPSDVPCPVETSTAHGEFFLWATLSNFRKISH